MRRVLVLNHFAVPLGEPGGTRHTELFGQLQTWDSLILAARVNPSTQLRQRDQPGFLFVPVTPFTGNGLGRILNWISYAVTAVLAGLIRAGRRPDVVYASSPHLLAGVAGAVLATVMRVPFVLEVRDLWPKVLVDMGQMSERAVAYRLLAWLERTLYRRADRIVALAEGTVRVLTASGVPPSKIVLIPNGADPQYFETGTSREEARRAYGFDRLTAVYTGAHGPANGLELLLDAAADVKSVDVVLVGDGVSRNDLVNRARDLGLENVSFREAVPKSEMPRLLLAADIGVHCLADVELFRYGVSPNKLFDYMAAGLPVVTNTPGDVAELVRRADSGIAVPPRSLAEGLAGMAEATELQRQNWGSNGRAYIADHHSRRIMRGRLLVLLDDLCPCAADPRP